MRYDAVNAMLLNEFLKEHRQVQQQAAMIAELESTVAHQRSDFEASLAKLQRTVDARLDQQAAQTRKASVQSAMSLSGGGHEMRKLGTGEPELVDLRRKRF